ncbi:MAG TPA: EamA family transporter [Gaiellales bacterium]|nr:EamA family transporter [Gaiellales bacterium]
MPADALALTLVAAALHAGWNVLIARAGDPEGAGAAAVLFAVTVFAPVAVVTWDVRASAIPYMAASAAAELVYFALLAAAYRRSEMSLVYPIARGLAPVLVLIGATVATSFEPTAPEVAGVVTVAIGVLLVRGVSRRGDLTATAMAVCIAATIAFYTVVDKSGLQHAATIPYFEVVLATQGILYASALSVIRGPGVIRAGFSRWSAAAGLFMFGAYGLVLAALRLAPAASVAAVRETSVVMATGLAAVYLHEHVSRERAIGAVLVCAGVVVLALA